MSDMTTHHVPDGHDILPAWPLYGAIGVAGFALAGICFVAVTDGLDSEPANTTQVEITVDNGEAFPCDEDNVLMLLDGFDSPMCVHYEDATYVACDTFEDETLACVNGETGETVSPRHPR